MENGNDPSDKRELFKSAYKSTVQKSYFRTIGDRKSTSPAKSRIGQTIDEIQIQEDVDESSLRVNRTFQVPQPQYIVYQKEGFVFKETEGFLSCLSSRKSHQLQLINTKLLTRADHKVSCFIDFSLVEAAIKQDKNHFTISVVDCPKRFYFQPTDKRVQQWVQLLNKVINESNGKKSHLNYLSKNVPDFYKNYAVSHKQFAKQANTGDILLFRSEHGAAKIQRGLTNSEYDHVGVVIRNKKNQIVILESSSNEGVGLTPWKYIIKYKWYEGTQKIVWRQLIGCKFEQSDYDTIERFAVKYLGKGFDISLDKLMTYKSTIQKTDKEEKQRTFFCSELVARFYKELHLISSETSSTQYYPVDFSDKRNLQFTKSNVRLEAETLISFGQGQ